MDTSSTEVAILERVAEKIEKTGDRITALEKVNQELRQQIDGVEVKIGRRGISSQPEQKKTVAQRVLETDAWKAFASGQAKSAFIPLDGLQLKAELTSTLFQSNNSPSGGTFPVAPQRDQGLWGVPLRRIGLLEVLPSIPVNSNAFEFVRVSSYGNAAAIQSTEGATKAEADLRPGAVTSKIATVAHFLKLSTQLLADAPSLSQQIEAILLHGVRAKLETEIVTGSSSVIDGILEVGTAYTPTATTRIDAIGEAIGDMASDGYTPSVVIMHPIDWFDLTRKLNGEGNYLLGPPNTAAPPVLWGVPVVLSAGMTEDRAAVLDLGKMTLLDRQSAVVEAGFVNDDFTRNLATLRCELRAGFALFDLDGARTLNMTSLT